MTRLRIATFNLENLDDSAEGPSLAARIAALRPILRRLDADILCLQEVNGQEGPHGRTLRALGALLDETQYAGYGCVATHGPHGPIDRHNLVVLSRFAVAGRQLHHEIVAGPAYRTVTAIPRADTAAPVTWDRPLLHAQITLSGRVLHVVNLHLRAPLAAVVPGQKLAPFAWKSVGGWAEGYYLAAMKRAGQALEARLLVEQLLDADPDALIAVAGDLNSDIAGTPLRILLGDEDDTGNPALAGRRLHAVEHALAPERRFSLIHGGHRWLVDHILASPALRVRHDGTEILNEALQDETAPTDLLFGGSFHAPLVATFDVSPPAEIVENRP
jgi:endonuclease/exonuclease/phosphatase family metal-dependent hydrolase